MIFWHFRFSSLTQHILMTEGFLNSNWFADHLSRQMQQKMNGKMKQISFSKCLLDLGPDSFPWELVELIIHLISYSEILEPGLERERELCPVPRYPGWLYVECYCVNWIKCLCSRYLKAGRWGRRREGGQGGRISTSTSLAIQASILCWDKLTFLSLTASRGEMK